MWGDSLTAPVAPNLQLLLPERFVFNGGVVGQTSIEIAARAVASADTRGWINVFWYGQNNENSPEQIKADIAASIATLGGNTRFVVLSVVNKATPEEAPGSQTYDTIIRLNRELAALYPQNYLDIRAFLVSQFDPTNGEDVFDSQNDEVPSSLRFDVIHLNNNGSVAVAKRLKQFIEAKGW